MLRFLSKFSRRESEIWLHICTNTADVFRPNPSALLIFTTNTQQSTVVTRQCAAVLKLKATNLKITKSNLHYTCGITPQRVASGGVHFHRIAPWQKRNVTAVESR